jgi:hypothetical protein
LSYADGTVIKDTKEFRHSLSLPFTKEYLLLHSISVNRCYLKMTVLNRCILKNEELDKIPALTLGRDIYFVD